MTTIVAEKTYPEGMKDIPMKVDQTKDFAMKTEQPSVFQSNQEKLFSTNMPSNQEKPFAGSSGSSSSSLPKQDIGQTSGSCAQCLHHSASCPHQKMRSLWFEKFGPLSEVLKFHDDFVIPTPGAKEALIKVHSTGINAIDWKMVEGMVPALTKKLPTGPGVDVSGTIVEFGAKELPAAYQHFKIGDEVFAFTTHGRGLAEYALVDLSEMAFKPKNLSHTQAASFPLTTITALQAFEKVNFKSGQRLLVLGGSTAVGLHAIQLAKNVYGASFIAATGRPKNFQLLQSLGVEKLIDYEKEKWDQILGDYTIDVVLDCVGGLESWEAANSSKVITQTGWFLTIVGDHPEEKMTAMSALATGAKTVGRKLEATFGNGTNYATLLARPDAKQLAMIGEWIKTSKLQPIIERNFDFKDSISALQLAKEGHSGGKLVVDIVRDSTAPVFV